MRYGDLTNTLIFGEDYVMKESKDDEKLNYEKKFYQNCKHIKLPTVLSLSLIHI